VWVQIEQNIFFQEQRDLRPEPAAAALRRRRVFDFTGKGFIGGITIERFRSAGRELERSSMER